jgi:pyruvate dehydrogenase E2 component (dihydrolipoamide acetyltransferase)
MSNKQIVTVPDIGSDEDVTIIEILVNEGQEVAVDDSLLTLESEKASMDIPSPIAGKVEKLLVSLGDKVKQGSELLALIAQTKASSESANEPEESQPTSVEEEAVEPTISSARAQMIELKVPDLGGASSVDVIEVLIKPGQNIEQDAALVTLESEKASMDIPASHSGTIEQVFVALGDKVSEGDVLALVQVASKVSTASNAKTPAEEPQTESKKETPAAVNAARQTESKATAPASSSKAVYASPAIRRIAREFGVDLANVQGSGRKGRILKEDVQKFVKERLSQPSGGSVLELEGPTVDFSAFGEIETVALNKIKRLTAKNMRRSWLTVPHVTQFDEADITELEAFRKAKKTQVEKDGAKLTVLAFIVKAVVKCLETYPAFNASLDPSGENLIFKHYYNIGIAVDTPNGLVVPVIKGANHLSVVDIAKEMGRLSALAREKKLMPKDMNGGTFTISSLGGIGGTAFTPIVNAPEVAILGVSRAKMSPVYKEHEFVPRLMLPLSLSYDHRVIDGAEAARFSALLANLLSDIRNLLI